MFGVSRFRGTCLHYREVDHIDHLNHSGFIRLVEGAFCQHVVERIKQINVFSLRWIQAITCSGRVVNLVADLDDRNCRLEVFLTSFRFHFTQLSDRQYKCQAIVIGLGGGHKGSKCVKEEVPLPEKPLKKDRDAPSDSDSVKTLTNKLFRAIKSSREDLLPALIEAGANVNKVRGEKNTQTPLSVAVSLGKKKMVSILLDAEADPNTEIGKDQQTPLHLAVKKLEPKRCVGILNQLIQAGGNVNAKDKHGHTPLFYVMEAFEEGAESFEVFDFLLTQAIDLNHFPSRLYQSFERPIQKKLFERLKSTHFFSEQVAKLTEQIFTKLPRELLEKLQEGEKVIENVLSAAPCLFYFFEEGANDDTNLAQEFCDTLSKEIIAYCSDKQAIGTLDFQSELQRAVLIWKEEKDQMAGEQNAQLNEVLALLDELHETVCTKNVTTPRLEETNKEKKEPRKPSPRQWI